MSTTAANALALRGWRRADGRVGVRDFTVVFSTVALTNRWAEWVAKTVDDSSVLVIAGELLRGLRGDDARLQAAMIEAIVRHPNVGRALLFAHDKPAAAALEASIADVGKPVKVLAFMAQAGMANAVGVGSDALKILLGQSRAAAQAISLGDLGFALECGGSDPTSGIGSNAVIGGFVDRVAAAGGFAIVSETAELIGAEDALAARCRDGQARAAVLACIAAKERTMRDDGEDYRGVNPTAENIEAGVTTLIEKTMGALSKTGTAPIEGALAFGQAPSRPGVWVMDTPFFSPVSISGMLAAGAAITLFGIGVFNPSGCPLAPTIKICANPQTVARWGDSVDVDVAGLLDGSLTLAGGVDRLAAVVQSVTHGVQTCAERWGEGQWIVPKGVPAL